MNNLSSLQKKDLKYIFHPCSQKMCIRDSLVGMLICVIGMALGGATGFAINPARDLGPRIAHK